MGVINILYLKKEITLGYSEDQFVQMLLHLNGDFDDDFLQDTLRLLTGIDWYVYQWNTTIKLNYQHIVPPLTYPFCPIFEDGAETVCSDTSAAGLVVADKTAMILFWLYVIAAEVCFVDYFFGIGQHILPIICIIVMIRDQYKHTNNL